MNLVGFAFKRTNSGEILKMLSLSPKFYINSKYSYIERFVEELIALQPTHILGTGMYSRRDNDKLRIETHYSKNGKKHPMNYFIQPSSKTKFARGIGNSYCNFVSMKIMEAIDTKILHSQYTFIHVPKIFDINDAVAEIESMINSLKDL